MLKSLAERQQTDEMAVRALFQALNAAWGAGDAAAYGALFTADADYLAFDGVNQKGRQAIIAGHKPLFETYLKGSRLTGERLVSTFLRLMSSWPMPWAAFLMQGAVPPNRNAFPARR